MIEELGIFIFLLIATVGGMLALYVIGTLAHLINRTKQWYRRKKNGI